MRLSSALFLWSAVVFSATHASSDLSRRQNANPPNRNPTPTTPSSTIVASATTDSSIAPSPTESTGCTLHGDHWHCDAAAEGSGSGDHDHDHDHGHSSEEIISETGGAGCVQHGTHWHCPAGVEAPCTAILGDYDLGMHVAALFILLVASSVGVFLPVLLGGNGVVSKKFSGIFFVLRHFGTGVIIATAFIHLLMHAFVMFENECLGELAYEAVAPAIAMASLMVVFIIDFVALRRMQSLRGTPMQNASDSSGSQTASSPTLDSDKPLPVGERLGHDHDFSCMEGAGLSKDGSDKRSHWEVQLLEAGICFHSVMIGVTLGAQGGSGFIPTFCAIIFHQLFEGLGLGSRIATLTFPSGRTWKKWLMCVVYTLITPFGIAIGIGVRKSFNLSGRSTLLAIGVLDSISAGILLYAGIAQLLVGEWLAGDMRRASTTRVVVGAVALFLGLFAMSLIGKWA